MKNVVEIPLGKIRVGEHEQRMEKYDSEIDGIAASISSIGVIEPLIVRKQGDSFLLVAGHRRLLAAARVGLSTVPCLLADGSENMDVEIKFAENFFRKDLSPVELACAIKDCWVSKKMNLKEIADSFHRSIHWVNSMMAIFDWPDDVQEAIHTGEISVSAASNLALVTDSSYRNFLVRNAIEQGATARTTASWLQAWRAMQPQEEAITSEPVGGRRPPQPAVPQAPCLCCGQIFMVNEMSHVPVCGACVQIIRQVGMSKA